MVVSYHIGGSKFLHECKYVQSCERMQLVCYLNAMLTMYNSQYLCPMSNPVLLKGYTCSVSLPDVDDTPDVCVEPQLCVLTGLVLANEDRVRDRKQTH